MLLLQGWIKIFKASRFHDLRDSREVCVGHLDHNCPDMHFIPDKTGNLEVTVEMSALHASILEELKGLRI